MFRLDRESLGNPCDLCIHNTASRGILGIQLQATRECKYCKQCIQVYGSLAPIISIVRKKDGFITSLACEHFELNVDTLERVVYNKLGFAVSPGTVGRIDQDGNLAVAYDPMWVVINSFSAIIKSEKINSKGALNNFLNKAQTVYPTRYCNKSDEDKCIIAAAYWFNIESNITLAKLSPKGRDQFLESELMHKALQMKMCSALNFFGHPFVKMDEESFEPDANKILRLIGRINEESKELSKHVNLVHMQF